MIFENQWPTLSAPVEGAALRVLSLGAGVQSTTLAILAARGDVGPMPDLAIFADTRWEPPKVMRHLDWLEPQLPFPVVRVSQGDLRADILAQANSTGQRFAAILWFTKEIGRGGLIKKGMGRRQCTKEYKLAPIKAAIRKALAVPYRARVPKGIMVEQWIGISLDEIGRMKPARDRWITNRHPLIEIGFRRSDCLKYLEERQYPAPPKSACIGCPFHTNEQWREMRDTAPDDWADAVAVDHSLRVGERRLRGQSFAHRSLVPLDQAPIDDLDLDQLGFDLECEGICGV